jgi:ATP-dependent DNA helicase HFM1/MER3
VEIILRTIINLESAIKWLKSTFLYARVRKNPQYYGIRIDNTTRNKKVTSDNPKDEEPIDSYLGDLCIRNLNELMQANLIEKCDFVNDSNAVLKPTGNGHLMARYCLAFNTMKSIITTFNNKLDFKNTNQEELFEMNENEVSTPQISKSLQELVTNE